MRKSIIAITIVISIVFATVNAAFSQSTSLNASVGTFQYPVPQQQYPFIILQPNDQSVPFGSNAIFSVTAQNTGGYQWLYNGNPISNGTNSTLVIQNVSIQNVGYYSCDVFKGLQSVPTRSALLQVYTNWIDPQTGVDPMVIYSYPYPSEGQQSSCPGKYVGYVYYTPGGNTWGYPIDTTNGNTVFTATDNNSANTKIQYVGEYGDEGCNQTTVTVPNPPMSPQYVFCIYFTNSVPTNAYPITLSGFNP